MLSHANNWNPKKRILKVAMPYVLWSLIYTVLHNLNTPTQIPICYLKSLVTGNAAAIMYYIFVYCELTLAVPLIDKLARSKYKYLGFLIAPIEIIFMRLIPMITGYQLNKYIDIIMRISCLGWFTYYYLGYLLGNNIVQIKSSMRRWAILWAGSIVLQIGGDWYFIMGEINCGTQLKLSSILTGVFFSVIAYKFINSSKYLESNYLILLGNCSFGVYFSHLAVMQVLEHIQYYSFVKYPLTAIISVTLSVICVLIGSKVLGKYSKYLAL